MHAFPAMNAPHADPTRGRVDRSDSRGDADQFRAAFDRVQDRSRAGQAGGRDLARDRAGATPAETPDREQDRTGRADDRSDQTDRIAELAVLSSPLTGLLDQLAALDVEVVDGDIADQAGDLLAELDGELLELALDHDLDPAELAAALEELLAGDGDALELAADLLGDGDEQAIADLAASLARAADGALTDLDVEVELGTEPDRDTQADADDATAARGTTSQDGDEPADGEVEADADRAGQTDGDAEVDADVAADASATAAANGTTADDADADTDEDATEQPRPEPGRREPVRTANDVAGRGRTERASDGESSRSTSTDQRVGLTSAEPVAPSGGQVSRPGAGRSPGLPPGVQRVLEAVEHLERLAPPRQLTLDIGDLRVRVSMEEGQVRLSTLSGDRREAEELLEEARQALAEQGFDLDGGEQDDPDQDPDDQPVRSPNRGSDQPRERAPQAGLRL